ncbi:tetraacyldisaccharide 4'-kinase [Flavobacterium orientale]|uniref:Tetraacyldisaccharide 4'-kinase n=1 Tax=Flavobacterium orientale TaxID=1756020 RepID=A0A916XWQ2_9FLAO|nr:tetraacyldisaccharide 4'-kinase [Flavobacterium orientale]GGD15760.1 tetraacyldisaccharide 4'-kinase [Flavobacterium orientale]
MILIRKLLFPFAILYGFVTAIRNFLYDKAVLKSFSFDVPVIAVGNLSVGGTGKTPQIEYLIRMLQENYQVATLSRGYKRKSKGFLLANSKSTVSDLGDESFQYHTKFHNLQVAVDADRVNGISQLLHQTIPPQVILLDDAFQHRRVKAGFYVLLTAFDDLYIDDFMLPTGNLREYQSGAKRASVVIVTKCPIDLSEKQRLEIEKKLQVKSYQKLFFSSISYDEFVYSETTKKAIKEIKESEKLLVSGIAKPKPFYDFVQKDSDEKLTFNDHHDFTESDIDSIRNKSKGKIIVTTEKDYMRLKGKLKPEKLFYLPIKSTFIQNELEFINTIKNYVEQSTRNR